MWQKPARLVLDVSAAIQNAVAFLFFCVFSGMLGALLQSCLRHKADLADQVSFGFLALSLSIFYGFQIYGMLAARNSRSHRLKCGVKLLFWFASFLVGCLVVWPA